MSNIMAIIFDLYGTILNIDNRYWIRELRLRLGEPQKRISAQMLRKIMITPYVNDDEMYADFCRAAGVDHPDGTSIKKCNDFLKEFVKSVSIKDGVLPVLAFLKNRNVKLAILSNVSKPFIHPVYKLGLEKYFDKLFFSCEIGSAKPTTSTYVDACRSLGLREENCLFIGDSKPNDFDAPKAAGIEAILIETTPREGEVDKSKIDSVSMLGLRAIGQSNTLDHLIKTGDEFEICGKHLRIVKLIPPSTPQQGRYNLLMRALANSPDGSTSKLYVKRYLDTNSIHVEKLAYDIMKLVGMNSCEVIAFGEYEKILVMTQALGDPWGTVDPDEDMSYGIGAHSAAAYIIGNADLRPRNTLVYELKGRFLVNVVDLEHCFFDRALEIPNDVDPFDPILIDRLDIDKLTKHRALSVAAIRRTRRSFIKEEDKSQRLPQAFRAGWIDAYIKIYESVEIMADMLRHKIYGDTPIIIGTKAYRRAMAGIDLSDILLRASENPEHSFEMHY